MAEAGSAYLNCARSREEAALALARRRLTEICEGCAAPRAVAGAALRDIDTILGETEAPPAPARRQG